MIDLKFNHRSVFCHRRVNSIDGLNRLRTKNKGEIYNLSGRLYVIIDKKVMINKCFNNVKNKFF